MHFEATGKPALSVFEHIRAPWLLLEAAFDACEAAHDAEEGGSSPPSTVVRHAAVCVVLAVVALEGYINEFLQRHAKPSLWGVMQRLGIRNKWQLAPRLTGADEEFQTDAPPWAKFSELVRMRNRIVHWAPPDPEKPGPAKEWGDYKTTVQELTSERASEACRTACEMIWQLHQLHGSNVLPGWGEFLERVEGPWREDTS